MNKLEIKTNACIRFLFQKISVENSPTLGWRIGIGAFIRTAQKQIMLLKIGKQRLKVS